MREKKKESERENDWPLAIEGLADILQTLGLDDSSLEIVIAAFSSPEQLTQFSRMIYQYGKNQPLRRPVLTILLQYADASPFPLDQWVEALIFFNEWLVTRKRKPNLVHMMGYLQCCANSPESKGLRQNLTSLLKTMLEFYDYKGC